MLNAFTVDVEDYYHVSAFADRVHPRTWSQYESRVVANTHRVMNLLDLHQVRATFFVLGWVAERFPQLVRDIVRAGHEIGCHSYWHGLVYELTPEGFREDIRRANASISDVTGERVNLFRAPSFSITLKSLWALDILVEEGIQFDSSVFPIRHDRYGIPGANRFPHEIRCPAGSLWEFPPSVHKIVGANVPSAGGGYFRLFPFGFTRYCFSRINQVDHRPVMFYVHPWELDADQPRLRGSLRSRFRHYQNLKSTAGKLERLLRAFRFGSLTDSLAAYRTADEPAVAAMA